MLGLRQVELMFESQETIRNDSVEPMTIWLEPWGFEHTIPPNSSIRAVAVSPIEGRLEVADYGDTLAIYGWSGATLKVYRDNELVDDVTMPLPDLGQMSARTFVEKIFGGPGGPYGGTA